MVGMLAVVGRTVVSNSILHSALLWVPGLGKAAESFPQFQGSRRVGHQLGFEEGFRVMIRICK